MECTIAVAALLTSPRTPLKPSPSYALKGYPLRMSELTSLKVPSEVRDRFSAAAKARGVTVRALLDELSRDVADSALMEQAGRQMSQLRDADPRAWNDYLAEGRHWEEGTIEPIGA